MGVCQWWWMVVGLLCWLVVGMTWQTWVGCACYSALPWFPKVAPIYYYYYYYYCNHHHHHSPQCYVQVQLVVEGRVKMRKNIILAIVLSLI